MGGSFTFFLIKREKGWVVCLWTVMSHFEIIGYLAHLTSK